MREVEGMTVEEIEECAKRAWWKVHEMAAIKRLGIAGTLTARALGIELGRSTQRARRILQRVQAAGFVEPTTDLEETGEPGRPARLWRLR
jgi:predicted ArsR family transcriptional regulator